MKGAGLDFEILPSDIPEHSRPGEAPAELAERLAREKALAVARQLAPTPRRWVLGADTIVVLEDAVLGKPRDAEHAVHLLSRLVGRPHRVVTGIAVTDSSEHHLQSRTVESQVHMSAAGDDEIRRYVATGEALDKAGAYALQGEGGRRFVDRVDGSRSNVIGLPLEETLELLDAALRAAETGRDDHGTGGASR